MQPRPKQKPSCWSVAWLLGEGEDYLPEELTDVSTSQGISKSEFTDTAAAHDSTRRPLKAGSMQADVVWADVAEACLAVAM